MPAVLQQLIGGDGCANFLHKAGQEGDIVDRCEPNSQNLIRLEQMTNICPGEVATGIALASLLDGSEIPGKGQIANGHVAPGGDDHAMASQAGWPNAVKHIYAPQDALDQTIGRANPIR